MIKNDIKDNQQCEERNSINENGSIEKKTNTFEQLAIILRRSKSSNQMARKQESFTRNTLRNTNLKMCQNFAEHIL